MSLFARSLIFYGVLTVALLALVTKAHALVLPAGLASQVGHNSEALLFALLVCAEVQFFRPWARRTARPWFWTVLVAAVMFLAAYLLLHSGWTSTLVTLNEPIFGAALVLLYVMVPRPFRLAPVVSIVVLAFVVVAFDTALVLDQAESLVPFMLAPLAFDVFDRTILEPEQPDRPSLRVLWIVLLLAVGLTFMLLAPWAREDLQGWLRYGIDYGQRASEAYWGWVLVHVYFGYVLGARWRRAAPEGARTSSVDQA
ncbi:hypothetical protein ACNHYB_14600 [Isoptericola jiangsuensis]|uniref:hypothetical protein n=1 Tax=Isoptericola jiangsuensis TaxID=548579 RepID=UPI003AAE8E79